jgi:hypothetical protein
VRPEELDPRTPCACGMEAVTVREGHLLCADCAQVMEAFEYDDIPIEET